MIFLQCEFHIPQGMYGFGLEEEEVGGKGSISSPIICVQFSSVHLLSRVQLFATPWIAARQASLSITNSRSSRKLRSISIGLMDYFMAREYMW